MKSFSYLRTFIVSCMLFTFVVHVKSCVLISVYCPTPAWKVFVGLVGALFAGLNIVAIVGLWLAKSWGRCFSYVAIAFTTIYFGVNYIPLSHVLFRGSYVALCGNMVLIYWITRLHKCAASIKSVPDAAS